MPDCGLDDTPFTGRGKVIGGTFPDFRIISFFGVRSYSKTRRAGLGTCFIESKKALRPRAFSNQKNRHRAQRSVQSDHTARSLGPEQRGECAVELSERDTVINLHALPSTARHTDRQNPTDDRSNTLEMKQSHMKRGKIKGQRRNSEARPSGFSSAVCRRETKKRGTIIPTKKPGIARPVAWRKRRDSNPEALRCRAVFGFSSRPRR